MKPQAIDTTGSGPAQLATDRSWSEGDPSVAQLARSMAEGRRSAVKVVEATLRVIAAREPVVRAFAHLDAERALEQARQRDATRGTGPLHGIPFAVKDVFDTADFPTEYNSSIYRGNRPVHDAACVARARDAGAVLIGKTVTSEFAHVVLGPTANPVDIRYSPGGSSSGSAAAVAAGFVPLTLGTQTGGSVIRPASYCGVYAFKPTFGRLPVQGVKPVAPSLDTVGLFAASVADLETLFLALCDAGEAVVRSPSRKRIAVCRASGWGCADADAHAVLDHASESLAMAGFRIEVLELPAHFDRLPDVCMTLLDAELAQSLSHEYARHRTQIGGPTRKAIEKGRAVTRAQLSDARKLQASCALQLGRMFDDFDAIVSFSAAGEAPPGRVNGDSAFNRVWTMLHVPCMNIPAGNGAHGLPIGVQLIGRRGSDLTLLALAREASATIRSTRSPTP
jgi:amidase